MDIAARRDDPDVEELARSIYTMFPRCMRCGLAIERYEDADVRVLSHRVVHKGRCAEDESADPSHHEGSGLSTGMPGDG